MKLTKKKVLLASLAICLVAIISFGTLAWFTAGDKVTNEFLIANSEDDPDDIFSVDVWEDATLDDSTPEDKIQDGIQFDDVLPGDKYVKEVHIENTGYYDQYIRATVTITGASVWQDVYDAYVVPLEDIVKTLDTAALYEVAAGKYYFSYYDAANDAFVYELYYKDSIAKGEEIIVFDTVNITENLDRYQAAEIAGKFEIVVVADAVQTENVGQNVYEAFETVGLIKGTTVVDTTSFAAALADPTVDYIFVDSALAAAPMVFDAPVVGKTIDFNGQDANVEFTATASGSDVVISGIVDTDGTSASVKTASAFTGNVTLIGCDFATVSGGALALAGGNITIDNCDIEGSTTSKTYGIYNSGPFTGNLTIKNTTFENFKSWAILINNTINGSLVVDNCEFNTPDGVLKTLAGGVTGDFTFTNNTMNANGHDGNIDKMVVSGSGNGPVVVGGTKTVANNTLNGEAWNQ